MIDPNDPRLTDYVLGELASSEVAEIERAIEDSPELVAVVEAIRATVGMLGDAYAGEDSPRLLDEQKVTLSSKRTASATKRQGSWIGLGFAATCAVVFFAGVISNVYFHSGLRRHNAQFAEIDADSWTFNTPYDNAEIEIEDEGRSMFESAASENGKEAIIIQERYARDPSENIGDESADEALPALTADQTIEQLTVRPNPSGTGEIPLNETSGQSNEGYDLGEDRNLFELRFSEYTPSSVQNEVSFPRENEDIQLSQGSFGIETPQFGSFKAESRMSINGVRVIEDSVDNKMTIAGDASSIEAARRQIQRSMDTNNDGERLRTKGQRGQMQSIATSTFDQAQRTNRPTNELLDELLTGIEEPNEPQQIPSDADTNRELAEVTNKIRERVWSLQNTGQLSQRIGDSRTAITQIELRLFEAQTNAELVKQRVGQGHPKFEEAAKQVQIIESQLEKLKAKSELEEKQNDELKERKITKLAEMLHRAMLRQAKPKSWKRVNATPNTTRLMVGDKEELDLNGMQVNAQVDGFRARVLVDYFYYNDREQQLEGNFKLRLPDDASLYYFAFGESAYEYSPKGKFAADEFLQNGTQFVSLAADGIKELRKGQWDNVKEARMVPREKAAHAFRETVRRRVDPTLVEWSGAGVFSAKVFPLAPKKLHRIVVGYDVNLKRSANGWDFNLSLPEHTGQCRVELNVQDLDGVTYTVNQAVDPIQAEVNGKLQKRFVFETGGAQDFSDIQLSVVGMNNVLLQHLDTTLPPGGSAKPGRANLEKESETKSDEKGLPLRSLVPRSQPSQRESGIGGEVDSKGDVSSGFWTTQVSPELPFKEGSANSRVIFMVDTSLSSSPDKFNVWLNLLESTLNNNRDSLKEFDVLFFNVDSHFWKGKYVANTQENVASLKQTLENLVLEGATDLYGAIETIATAEWAGDAANRPDLFLLSDGAATWGETDLRLIDRLLQQPQLGSLFAYQTGLTGTAISGLRFLAGQSGGAVFSVASEDEIKTASMAHRKRPWQLKSVEAKGASDILTAGRVQWVYPGQAITIVGRGNVRDDIKLEFQQANKTKTVAFTPMAIESELASRMYGQVSVGQLESLGSQVFDVSAAYARHFRVTGKNCSLLMLESEEDYKRFDIKPEEDLFVVKAKATSDLAAETLRKFANELADPKAKLQAWINRLESMPGMKFEMPTALKLAMDDIEIEAISQPLDCTLTTKGELSASYLKTIVSDQFDYDPISAEAKRRLATSADDAIKVYSSLVERSPSDIIVARDIAFTAMEMDRPAQAFHLLRRVARARPFQGNIYPAIGQCLAQMGKADMAIVYYEIAMNGTFQRQGNEFKQIVSAEYIHLLRQIVAGRLKSSVKDFAAARLETLGKHLPFGTADVVVTMMWNQDQTDVDMHVVEPSGEECYYSHNTTRSGGHITSDITTGFGPEMYFNANAPKGKYQLKAKYFGSGQNRSSTRNKVYVTIIRGFGTEAETITRRTVQLSQIGEVEPVMTLGIE